MSVDSYSMVEYLGGMSHKPFLEKFGPAKDAAGAFKATERDISHWKIRGIPARHWPLAETIAKSRGWPDTALSLSLTVPNKDKRH
jgi:hypothetical protein